MSLLLVVCRSPRRWLSPSALRGACCGCHCRLVVAVPARVVSRPCAGCRCPVRRLCGCPLRRSPGLLRRRRAIRPGRPWDAADSGGVPHPAAGRIRPPVRRESAGVGVPRGLCPAAEVRRVAMGGPRRPRRLGRAFLDRRFFGRSLLRGDFLDCGLAWRAVSGPVACGVSAGLAGGGRGFLGVLILGRSCGRGRWERGSGVELVENFVGDFEVGENVHGVGVVVELVVKFGSPGGRGRDRRRRSGFGNGDEFFGFELKAGLAQGVGDRCRARSAAVWIRMLVVVALDVIGAGFDGGFHHLVLAEIAVGDADFALAVELIGNAARGGDAAAVLGEESSGCRRPSG